ncbi:hypothetical protein D3C72_1666610 [compost metagenome]
MNVAAKQRRPARRGLDDPQRPILPAVRSRKDLARGGTFLMGARLPGDPMAGNLVLKRVRRGLVKTKLAEMPGKATEQTAVHDDAATDPGRDREEDHVLAPAGAEAELAPGRSLGVVGGKHGRAGKRCDCVGQREAGGNVERVAVER